MTLPDFASYDDVTLDAARVAAGAEQERRARLVQIPAQIHSLAACYVDDGGEMADLSMTQP